MRAVPPREWLGVSLPPLLGVILLIAGAASAAGANAWLAFALAATIGVVLPLIYTLQLAREHRLFLRSDVAVARNRSRIAALTPIGWVLGAAALTVLVTVSGSSQAVLYGALGGVSIGLWPGLLANFIRLRREEWDAHGPRTNMRDER